MKADGRLSGRVIGPDGRGIGAAVVGLHKGRVVLRPLVVQTATTAADGAFHFDGILPGRYFARAKADGFTTGEREDLDVESGASLDDVRIQLWSGGGTLSGRVLDAGGGFIPRAQLRATSYAANAQGTHDRRAFQTEADSEGRYRMRLPLGLHRLTVFADGYASITESRDVYGDYTKDFNLQPAARISGRVVMENGRDPVGGAQILVAQDGRVDPTRPAITSDERGQFVIPSLTPGRYVVSARKAALSGRLPHSIVLDATDAIDDVEILMSTTFSLRGRVTSAAGGPIVSARISVEMRNRPRLFSGSLDRVFSPGRTFTDAEGVYVIEGLLPRSYHLVVSADGHATTVDPIAVSADLTHDVVLQATAVATGLVLMGDGRPAAGAVVRGSLETVPPGRGFSVQTITDSQGRFRLTGLGAGVLTVTARHEAEAGMSSPVTIESGGRHEVSVRLGTGAAVAGVVSWDDGSPVANAMVMIVTTLHDGGRTEVEAFAARNGAFALRGIPAGTVILRAAPLGRHVDEFPEEPGADQLSLTLLPGEQKTGLSLVVRR